MTETALVHRVNDALLAIDKKKCVALVLLDMPAAFNTVDHAVLLRRLSDRLAIRGKAIDWISSYLDNRRQFVLVDGTRSSVQNLDYNVLQRSVLGPGLFSDYNSPVSGIFHRHNSQFHLYADNTQIYLASDQCDEDAIRRLEGCINEIRLWMAQNSLKLNDSKTDFIVWGNKHSLKECTTLHITIGDSVVEKSDYVKHIATLDNHLKLDKQVNLVCKHTWFSLY